MNPLLNRIYQSQNRKLSKGPKQSNTAQDQVLVPKLNAKVKLQAINTPHHTDRQIYSLPKPYIGRLPSLQRQNDRQQVNLTQKRHQSNSRKGFRNRRLSSQFKDNQTFILRDQTPIIKEDLIPILKDAKKGLESKTQKRIFFEDVSIGRMENVFQKIPTLSKQSLGQNQGVTLQENVGKRRMERYVPSVQQKIQKDQDEQDELFEYLKVLQNNEDLNEQFCYMNRGQKPYSFYIVDYDKRNLKEYLTVSLRGVTHYKTQGDETSHQFFTIKNLAKEIRRYKTLKKVSFFKNYLKYKIINHWKLAMVSNKFQNQCNFLTENLLSQNYLNQTFFYQLHSLYHQFSSPNFFNFDINETLVSLKQLKLNFMILEIDNIQSRSQIFERGIKKYLMECLTQNMKKFRIQKRVTLGTSDKLQKTESFLPFDNKKKSMKFTQLAKLKQFQGYLYKIIKYTDMVRYNLKIQQVKNSLINSRKEMDNLFQNYKYRNSRAFISWVQCRVQVSQEKIQVAMQDQINQGYEGSFLTSEVNLSSSKKRKKSQAIKDANLKGKSQQTIKFSPSIQQIRQSLIQHKQLCIKQLWQNHFFLIEQKNQLLCQQLEIQDPEIPTKVDLKYYIQNTPELIELNQTFQSSLSKILQELQKQKNQLSQTILKIYTDSFLLQPIQNYLQNQRLKSYLDSYLICKQTIQKCQQFIQFGLVILKIDTFKAEVKHVFQEKYKAIVTAIPQQVLKRTQSVARQVRDLYFKFKENPTTIRQFIEFYKIYYHQKPKLTIVQSKIEDLLQLQAMILSNKIKMPQNSRVHIAESQSLFRDLQKRFQEIQNNQDKDRKRFQILIDQIIPVIEEKAEDLLKQINFSDQLNNPQTQILKIWQKIKGFQQKFIRIKKKKQELFDFQEQLKLGHKDLENYFKLQNVFKCYKTIWLGHQDYLSLQKITKQKGYGQIQNIETNLLKKHLQNIDQAFNEIEAIDLLEKFKLKTTRVINVIKLSKLIGTDTFQQEHCQKIKGMLVFKVKKIKDLIFTRQGSRTIVCDDLYENTNIFDIEAPLQETAFLSGRENVIKKELNDVQELWKKSKLKFRGEDIVGNGSLVLRLDTNEELQQKIGIFSLSLKNIQKSGHAIGSVLQRLLIQIKITKYLSELLQLWAEVEKQWLKLLPLMTNCPSVKHQSNVFYEFSGVDSAMKKMVKQISEMSSLRRVVEDHQEKKYLNILSKCGAQLKEINITLEKFLQAKRSVYSRFNFLTDEQLINVIQNVKDSKSMAIFGGYCFNCEEFQMENQLISGMKSEHETFRLRKAMLRGQPQQMFKSIEQNMRTSFRMSIKSLIPKMKVSPNIEQQLRQNSLQMCLLADIILWTEMGQNYLNHESYDEYFLIVKRLYEQMARLLPKIDKDMWIKLSIRLTQASNLKQQSQNLIIDQTQRNDFRWKSTMKFYLQEEQISIKQFDMKLNHGLQYYPSNKIYVPTQNSQALLNQMYYSCLHYKVVNIQGPQGQGKRSLIQYTASRLGIYSQQVVCNQNLSVHYLQRFLQGTLNSAAWLTFYESSSLKPSVTFQLLQRINQLINNQNPQPKTLFILANHSQDINSNYNHPQYHQIQVFKYHSYTLVEPDHKQISNYLFQMHRFREWQQLSNQLLSYMKTIQPLIQNVIGTPLSLLRKIIDGAGAKKLSSSNTEDETKMLVDQIFRQIIDKSDDKVAILLKKALISYFNIQQALSDPKLKYLEKLDIFKQILTRKDTKNILTIGSRSCKSTLISQAIKSLKIQSVKLFPQSQTQYLTPFSIEQLNSIPSDKVLIYDGDQVISQFVDIITSGYLLVDGRKLAIMPKIILQLRTIQNCAPSFIQNCQIIYIGNIITKWEKFRKFCPLQENDFIEKILQEIFGQDLNKLNDEYIETFAKFINQCKGNSHASSMHKLIIWLLSVLQNQDLWQKNYPGKYTDFTINQQNLQLVSIDLSKNVPIQYFDSNFYFIPTKSSVLFTDLTNCSVNFGLNVQVFGSQQIGKTAFINFLKDNQTKLSVNHDTEHWAQRFKDKLLTVRKQGKNFLIPLGDASFKIIVDDLDLGAISHQAFLRSLIETSQIRDSKYQPYFLKTFGMVVTSRNRNLQSKLDQCFVKIPLMNQSKESFSTIFSSNFNYYTKKNNFNREVIDYIDRTVLKSLLIAFDDLSVLNDSNVGSSLLMSLVKDLLSIPKKNSFISIEDFTSLFKTSLYQRIVERSFNRKLSWQLNSIFENIAKILFENNVQKDHWVNIGSHYNKTTDLEMKDLIGNQFKSLIVYPSMINKVIYINNHLQNINSNVVIIGRKGVGKKYLTKIVAYLNKVQIVQTIKQAILKAIKKQQCILVQEIKPHLNTMFCQLRNCEIDKDLEVFLDVSQKQKLREHMDFKEGLQSTAVLKKIKQFVKYVALLDDKYQYFTLCNQIRQFTQFSVCLTDQWPIEAIINLHQIPDGKEIHHAEIFIRSNSLLLQNGLNCMSMGIYQKYVRVFTQIYQQKKTALLSKQQSLKKMYYKFNEAGSTIRQWQSKVGSLQIEIIETIQDLSKKIQIDKMNSQMLFSIKKRFDQKQAIITTKKNDLENTKNQLEKELKQTKTILQKIQKILNSLQRTEMSQLKKIYKTNKLVQFGLQCLCILLKQKQDDLNEKTINKLLADPNLLMKMKSSNLLDSKNIDLINRFKKDMPSYELMLKNHTTETSKILIQWVKSIIEYWQITDLYKIKRKDFKILQNYYNEVSEDFESIKLELRNLSEKSNQLNKQLKKLQEQKIFKEKQILLIKKSLQNSSDVIPILFKTQRQIYGILNKVNLNLNNLQGNCILVAFTITYLPLKRLTIKSKLIQAAKKYLKNNLLPCSDSYIYEIVSDNLTTTNLEEGIQTVQSLNAYILKNFSKQIKVVIDPHRKFFSFIQTNKMQDFNDISNIIEKAEDLTEGEFKTQYIYHSTSQKLQIADEKCIVIDWKSIQTNPEERLFNKIALSKKPQYFEAKTELRQKIQKNLEKIDNMKNNLYQVICQSALKILEDENFLQNGRKLIALQQQNETLQKQIKNKVELIHGLSDQIKVEVRNIFLLLGVFKILRPIGLDLVLEVASRQGNSTQNVLSWALANLPEQKRLGYLFYFANQVQGKKHQNLISQIIVNAVLKPNQLKIKRPGLVNALTWQKVLKMSTYTQGLKPLVEVIQKHQKQFQTWCNNSQILFPQALLPDNLSLNEHLFIIYHLKPKIFSLTVNKLTRQVLKQYELKPMENTKILSEIGQVFPVVYHGEIYKLQKICEQVNQSRMQKVRIGSIRTESEMRNKVWKYIQNQQWMVIYGISSSQDLNWLQKIVEYALSHQSEQKFKVIIIPDIPQQNSSQQLSFIQSSKYLTSISIHLYDSIPTLAEIIKSFPLYHQDSQNQKKIIPAYLQEEIPKSPRTQVKVKSRKSSVNQTPQNKISSLLKLDQITLINKKLEAQNFLALPQLNSELQNGSFIIKTKGNDRLLTRLYKHILLAFLVILKRFKQKIGKNTFQIMKRCIETLKFIEQNQIPIQQNVQYIVNYLSKVYFNELSFEERKCLQQILERIIDQTKFNQKTIFGVNIAALTNVDSQLINNSTIFGTENSFFIRQSKIDNKELLKTLNEIMNKQNIKEQTSYLKAILSKIPVFLSNKEIKNQNYLNFYQKEQKLHNQQIKRASDLLNWINIYEGKKQSAEQIEVLNEYNWKNLLRKMQNLVGQKFNKNLIRDVCMNFMMRLRKSHEFLLYLNPSYSSFIVNPVLVSNLQELISVYTINYFQSNNVRDAFNYIQNVEFKRISNNSELNQLMFQYGMQGIVFNNLKCRDFKWNHQQRQIEALTGVLQGEQRAPVIFFKLRKLTNSKKEQQETIINLQIRQESRLKRQNQQKTHLRVALACTSTYPQFNLRDNCLVVEDEND